MGNNAKVTVSNKAEDIPTDINLDDHIKQARKYVNASINKNAKKLYQEYFNGALNALGLAQQARININKT